uniref:CRC domain-containing protein n=1 Tax=Aureoumbra lagunensis TaxID=44058 RepID=A0A6S8DAU9_9STRA
MRDMSVSPSRNSSLSSAEKKEDVYEENFYVRSQEDEKNEVKRKPLASRRPSNISPYENRMNNDIFMKRYAQNIDHEILEEERLARKRKSETPLRACNCKRSKCLKLYCECYAAGVFCFDCNCTACENTVPTTYKNFTKERITHADAGGTPTLPPPTGGSESSTCNKRKSHAKQRDGCNCKKSKCLKKYCECYEADGHCDEKCKCINCKNYPGSAELYAARTKHNKIIVSNNKLSDNLSENRRKKITPSPEFISNNNICGDDTIHKQIITPQPEQRYSFEKPQPKKYRVSQRKLRTAWLTTLNNGRSIALKNVKSIIHVVAKKEDACHAAQTVFDTIVARDTEQINQAKRIAIAAATEGTRAVSRKQLSKAEELCVAKAVGTATYSAVLDSIREEKLARAAGDWSQIAASTAREISILSENTDQTLDVQLEKSAISTVNSLASAWQPDEAKLAEEISINFSRIAAKFKSRATYLEKLALLLENPRNLESLAKRHNAFMTHADVRDGPPIQSGLGRIDRKPILIKIFQCLGNEDLFGASLVSQDWTNVAFDHKLWDFDFKAQLNISYSTSLLNSTSIDIPSPIRQKKKFFSPHADRS